MPKPVNAARDAARSQWHARFDNRKKIDAGKPGKLEVRALGSDTTEMLFYDEVGFWGITAEQFNAALATVNTANIRLRINSPGGDVFEGYAIYNALKAHAANIDVIVDGIAASAASFIALAGSTLTMGDPSMLMIHRAFTLALGNTKDMQAAADLLAKVDGQIADIYAGKCGKSQADMLALMDAETWLTAQEAGDLGLVDEIAGDNEPDEDDMAAQAHAARARAATLIALRA